MTPMSIEEIRQVQMAMLDEIDRVCADHGLHYLLAYGTCIGAMRHKGFIPWDDDVDIMMPREDYEVMAENFERWTNAATYEVAWYKNGKSSSPYVKIRDNSTYVKEQFIREDECGGIWVDVFPIDREPEDRGQVYRRFWKARHYREMALSDPKNATSMVAKVVKNVVYPLTRNLDPFKYAKALDENIRDCPKKDNGGLAQMVHMDNEFDAHVYYPTNLFEAMRVPFEDRSYLVPVAYDEVLTNAFGDWRTPPDEGNRIMHASYVYRIDR